MRSYDIANMGLARAAELPVLVAFRCSFLRWAARCAGRDGFEPAKETSFADIRANQLDLLGDLVEKYLDTNAIRGLLDEGLPSGLPTLPPGASA